MVLLTIFSRVWTALTEKKWVAALVIYAVGGSFYFISENTRLQGELTVTLDKERKRNQVREDSIVKEFRAEVRDFQVREGRSKDSLLAVSNRKVAELEAIIFQNYNQDRSIQRKIRRNANEARTLDSVLKL